MKKYVTTLLLLGFLGSLNAQKVTIADKTPIKMQAITNINSAGLRNQERPVFEQKLAEWQKYGMDNRDRLRNPRQDRGQASLEFQNKYQDILNLVQESKMEEEKKKQAEQIMNRTNNSINQFQNNAKILGMNNQNIANNQYNQYKQNTTGGRTRKHKIVKNRNRFSKRVRFYKR
jgi:hypothetical protein